MKFLQYLLTLGILYMSFAIADDTTIYESKDAEGNPVFSSTPTSSTSSKPITIDNEAPVANPVVNQEEQQLQNQNQQLDQTLQKDDQNLEALKQKVDESQQDLEQAEDNLAQARTVQDEGESTIAGDQFIDDYYIRHLEEEVDLAKQQLAVDQNNYTNYAKDSGG